MKETPILFSTPMVKAILEGRKTQTRRIFKGTTEHKEPYNPAYLERWKNICPYGQVGDHLWVREKHAFVSDPFITAPYVQYFSDKTIKKLDSLPDETVVYNYVEHPELIKWRPSIHMPHWASRITLEITNIRAQRIQDISNGDCEAEGVRPSLDGNGKDWLPDENGWHRTFRQLWNTINSKRGYGWETNCWVWAITFKRIEQEG